MKFFIILAAIYFSISPATADFMVSEDLHAFFGAEHEKFGAAELFIELEAELNQVINTQKKYQIFVCVETSLLEREGGKKWFSTLSMRVAAETNSFLYLVAADEQGVSEAKGYIAARGESLKNASAKAIAAIKGHFGNFENFNNDVENLDSLIEVRGIAIPTSLVKKAIISRLSSRLVPMTTDVITVEVGMAVVEESILDNGHQTDIVFVEMMAKGSHGKKRFACETKSKANKFSAREALNQAAAQMGALVADEIK